MPGFFSRVVSSLYQVCRGLGVVSGHTFREPITQNYPDVMPDLAEHFRGRLALTVNPESGEHLCISCRQCERVCPDKCIEITAHKSPETNKLELIDFKIDHGLCMFCGLCTEVCPTLCIINTKDFEMADYTRESLVYDLKKLTLTQEESAYYFDKKEMPLPKPKPAKAAPAAAGAAAAGAAKPAAAAKPAEGAAKPEGAADAAKPAAAAKPEGAADAAAKPAAAKPAAAVPGKEAAGEAAEKAAEAKTGDAKADDAKTADTKTVEAVVKPGEGDAVKAPKVLPKPTIDDKSGSFPKLKPESADKASDESAKTDAKSDEQKATSEETKSETAKSEKSKSDEAKPEEPKSDAEEKA